MENQDNDDYVTIKTRLPAIDQKLELGNLILIVADPSAAAATSALIHSLEEELGIGLVSFGAELLRPLAIAEVEAVRQKLSAFRNRMAIEQKIGIAVMNSVTPLSTGNYVRFEMEADVSFYVYLGVLAGVIERGKLRRRTLPTDYQSRVASIDF